MCTNSKIITNPRFIQASMLGTFSHVHTPSEDFFYHRGCLDEFSYRTFSRYYQFANKDNLDQFYAYNPSTGETIPLYIEVECGHCKACIEKKRSSLKNRMILEQYAHGDIPPIFLTLTYDDAHLPSDGVNVLDVQLFLKRFRSYQ